jgi:capsular exopolysaccharide synthesis family protein
MSRLFEALSSLKTEHRATEVVAPLIIAPPAAVPSTSKQESKPENHSLKAVQPTVGLLALAQAEPVQEVKEINEAVRKAAETVDPPAVLVSVSPESHLVALTDPNSLGAEKFRALVTRFDHLRNQRELRSFQVTSSVIDEGKTLVAGNVAVTLSKYSGSKTLLVEGDLHRPTLASLFGLNELRGLNHWWSGGDQELGKFVYRLNGMPLWFLPAGKPCDQPSDLLRSARFVKAFAQLSSQFEWIVVDSTPMLPIVDVNLWSRLVDGTVLVVRQGVTPVKALKRGLRALDHPKLIGVVVNEATEFDQVGYPGQYYGGLGRGNKSPEKK